MIVKYRHVVPMPDVIRTGAEFKESIFEKHIDDIMEGKSQVLLSPVYKDKSKNKTYLQPIFDFDGKRASLLTAFDEARKVKSNMNFNSIYEQTQNGVHLVFLIAIDIDPEDMRNEVKGLFKSLDVSSSFRDMPIFRSGSYREEKYTMIPRNTIEKDLIKKIKGKTPGELYSPDKWIELWNRYLFPKRIVDAESFINQLKKIASGGK
ncbi:MAG TPA: hypothetical protein P5513_06285 [Candidatus Diapherotrites archaeon]|nr:hypothetical protein [Candidatus Diapherotrites archaeon]